MMNLWETLIERLQPGREPAVRDAFAVVWDEQEPSGVAVHLTRNGIEECEPLQIRLPENESTFAVRMVAALKSERERLGNRFHSLIIIIPRETAMVRQIELPIAPPEDLPDMVRFQASSKLATPVDSLVLDFIPLPQLDGRDGQHALVFALEQRIHTELKKVAEAIGMDLVRCRVSSIISLELAVRAIPQPHTEVILAIQPRGKHLDLSILDAGKVVFSHSAILPEDDSPALKTVIQSELARTMVSLHHMHTQANLSRVVFLPRPGHDLNLIKLLEERFGNVLQILTPSELSRRLPHIVAPNNQSLLSLGAALSETDSQIEEIDFVRPRQRPPQKNLARIQLIGGGIAALFVLAISGWWYQGYLASLDDQISVLKKRVSELDEVLKAGSPKFESFKQIEDWRSLEMNPLFVAQTLEKYLPGTDRLYLEEVKICRENNRPGALARITGKGVAKRRDEVESFSARLSENGFRVTPKTFTEKTRDPAYPVGFDFDVELLAELPAKDAVKSTKGTKPGKT